MGIGTKQISRLQSSSLQKQPAFLESTEIRKNPPMSLAEAVEKSGKALSVYSKEGQGNVVLLFIKERLIKTLGYLGAFDVATEYQIEKLAKRIQEKVYYFSMQELDYFFTAFEDGQYGKLYAGRSVNPQDIIQGLLQYKEALLDTRGDVENKRRLEEEAKEHLRIKQNAVSYEEYLRMKGKTPAPGESDLLQKLKDRINKNK